VSGTEICWYFGPGLWHYRVALSDIEGVRIVRNTWLNGFGIRVRPGWRLYNVSGLDAVELRLDWRHPSHRHLIRAGLPLRSSLQVRPEPATPQTRRAIRLDRFLAPIEKRVGFGGGSAATSPDFRIAAD
jgi:hypothetical protein